MAQTKLDEALVTYDSGAVARVASGTAVAIATLLSAPDAVALLPSSESVIGWFLRLLCIWLSAMVLWFAGYLSLMYLIAWLTKGVFVRADGIKLWRFGKPVPWQHVLAIGVEPQHLFSICFGLKPPARRLTLFVQNSPDGPVAPHSIPSIFFSEDKFTSLTTAVSNKVFGFAPDSQAVLLAPVSCLPLLKPSYKVLHWARIALSIVVACSLVSFLARKAVVNYFYNSGNCSLRAGQLESARQEYTTVTKLDPYFAVAWQNLGITEFRLGHVDTAQSCWQKALALKPDLVESKVSLAYLYINRRDFKKARDQLDRALRLAPGNVAALVDLADLQLRQGQTGQSVRTARMALSFDPDCKLALCLIARGRLRAGQAADAWTLLEGRKAKGGLESEPYCLLVKGEIAFALGRRTESRQLIKRVLEEEPGNSAALQDLAQLDMADKDWRQAEDLLVKAHELAAREPGPLLSLSELYLLQKNRGKSAEILAQAIALAGDDASALTRAARLSLDLARDEQARRLAERALQIESSDPECRQLLDKLSGKAAPQAVPRKSLNEYSGQRG
jgi:tetratricopeptide (TPR) repeat protein